MNGITGDVSGINFNPAGQYRQSGIPGTEGIGFWAGSSSSAPAAPPPSSLDNGWRAQLEASNRQLAALQAQIAAQPKLLNFNITDAWARARSQAEAQVTPFYQAKINNLINQLNVKRETERTGAARTTQELETGLANTLQDIGTNRERTTEDVNQNLADIGMKQDQFQEDTGQQFDTARDALAAKTAESGLATSGLGAQQTGVMQQQRNTQEARQVQQFKTQEKLQQQFKNRTFADLATKEGRTKEQTAFQKEGVQFNLTQALKSFDLEQEQSTRQNEYERQQDIVKQSGAAYGGILGEFLAQQQARGARAQDIALSKQVYGF